MVGAHLGECLLPNQAVSEAEQSVSRELASVRLSCWLWMDPLPFADAHANSGLDSTQAHHVVIVGEGMEHAAHLAIR